MTKKNYRNCDCLERLDYLKAGSQFVLAAHTIRYEIARKFIRPGSKILDLGCGFGWGTDFLSFQCQATGIDINCNAIKNAKRRYKNNRKAKFMIADALCLPFKEKTFDCVVSIENIEHVKDSRKCLSEIRRVVKRGGVLIISTPERRYLGGKIRKLLRLKQINNPYHVHEFSEKELIKMLKNKGFTIKKVKRLIPGLPIKILNFLGQTKFSARLVCTFTPPVFNSCFLIVARKE